MKKPPNKNAWSLSGGHSSCLSWQSPRTSRTVRRVIGFGSVQTLTNHSYRAHGASKRDNGPLTVLMSFKAWRHQVKITLQPTRSGHGQLMGPMLYWSNHCCLQQVGLGSYLSIRAIHLFSSGQWGHVFSPDDVWETHLSGVALTYLNIKWPLPLTNSPP